MPELLLELGCEELPASFVRKAFIDLHQILAESLTGAGVLPEVTLNYPILATPRRLIICFPHVLSQQPDSVKEQRGPGLKAAYDGEGKPTNALQGFCRSQGIELADLRKDDQYVWITKTVRGKPTAELLAEILPKAIRALTFAKSMRWGSSRMRFARPIRWILAVFDGSIVDFEIEGVVASNLSRGHRFYAPEPFIATNKEDLLAGLRDRKVEPDAEVRKGWIRDQSHLVSHGTPDLPPALVDENVFLTEWPTAISGHFRSEYGDLPEAVLITAMAKHEKMFPVRDEGGRLTNQFVFIRNSGRDDDVRSGAEWVLNARFNDAKFFYDEDRKYSLDAFLARTEAILFQDKLGNVRQRADRLAELAGAISKSTGAPDYEAEEARQAGLYAKADLSTGLVSELASLQGIIGGDYARREGMPGAVAWSIATQYDPSKNPNPATCSGERTGLIVTMADQLDKLAGYVGIGHLPTGSSDPFALRRAATLLIEIALQWPVLKQGFSALLIQATRLYEGQGIPLASANQAVETIFASRYESIYFDNRPDLIQAAISGDQTSDLLNPGLIAFRLRAISSLAQNSSFVQTATRPINIVANAMKKNEPMAPMDQVDLSSLDSPEGVALAHTLTELRPHLDSAVQDLNAAGLVKQLMLLQAPINAFFDSTMVMAQDATVRRARLSLMQAAAAQLQLAGDFTKLVIEG